MNGGYALTARFYIEANACIDGGARFRLAELTGECFICIGKGRDITGSSLGEI